MTDSRQRTAPDSLLLVRTTWQQVLGHQDFNDDDHFFSVSGGNSLTAVQVAVRLSQELGVRLPVRLIMRHRTVKELAAAVAEQVAA